MGRPRQFDTDAAVASAAEVFWTKGYRATTPQDLVDALGIGKGSLYHAFGSKRELFELALRRYRDNQARELLEMLREPIPVLARLHGMLTFLVETDLAAPGNRGCLAVNTAAERPDPEAVALVRTMFARIETAFRDLVEQGRRDGELPAELNAEEVGSLLLNTVVGLRLLGRVDAGPRRRGQVIESTIALLRPGDEGRVPHSASRVPRSGA